jgi:hypothetical protein
MEILAALGESRSTQEWNDICDDVKAYMKYVVPREPWYNGGYSWPNWWYETVLSKIIPPGSNESHRAHVL